MANDCVHANSEIDYKKVEPWNECHPQLETFPVMGRISGWKCKIKTGAEHLQVWSAGCETSTCQGEGGEAVSGGEDICGPEDCSVGGRSTGELWVKNWKVFYIVVLHRTLQDWKQKIRS